MRCPPQVHKLTNEIKERGKWEALRLNEFLKRNEEEWKSKVHCPWV